MSSEVRITVLNQLDQLEEIVLEGSRIPFSGARLVNEQDAIEMIDALRAAIPDQILQADALLRKREEFVEKARQQAEEIVVQARRERDQLIQQDSVRQEAERQAGELREQANQRREQMLLQARQQLAQAEQEHQERMAQLDQLYSQRRQQLEQESAERGRLLQEQHEKARQQAMQDLEALRQEGLRLQRDSQAEAERLHNEAVQFGKQTQAQCEALVARSRHESTTIQDGANRYAEQVLGELEKRLQELSQVVMGGRQELGRLQAQERPATVRAEVSREDGQPMNRARRAANRLSRVTRRGLAS